MHKKGIRAYNTCVSTPQTKLKKRIGMYAYPMLLIPQIHCCRNKSMIEFTLLVSSC